MQSTTLRSAAATLAVLACASPVHAALIAHWSFDEGSGTTAANGANPAFPGTIAGGTVWTTGPAGFGAALAFDGVDDQVDTTFGGITGSAARTVTAWVRYPSQPTTSPNEFDAIVSWGNNSPNGSRWTFRISDSAAVVPNRLRLEIAGGGVYGNTDLNDDLWHHVAVVQTGTTLGSVLLYVDGQPQTLAYNGAGASLAINTAVSPTTQVRIGASGHATNYNITGSIDDVRMYDEVLTQAQIQALMVPEPSIAALSGMALALTWRRRR